ncbi:hypothetical protein SK128_012692 [Halocaridina rubra]|uniref:Uncharacterized protein n=1 Tax=Halocaridina rubra TaxID=373956 RepID=A0AAN8XC17_HALRR
MASGENESRHHARVLPVGDPLGLRLTPPERRQGLPSHGRAGLKRQAQGRVSNDLLQSHTLATLVQNTDIISFARYLTLNLVRHLPSRETLKTETYIKVTDQELITTPTREKQNNLPSIIDSGNFTSIAFIYTENVNSMAKIFAA